MGTLRQLGPARLGIMGAVVVGLLFFFVFISMRVSAPQMKLLYGDLAQDASASIAGKLEEASIKYEVSPDGSRIMVPEKDVGRARLLLVQSGLPDGGNMGYEIFDKESGFGTTNFVQNIKQVRALEGELARTIMSIESIRTARVHLVLPQRELFSRENRPASASVFLDMKSSGRLSEEHIAAIQALISSAVPELQNTNVSIIDSKGNLLARGGETGDALTSSKTEELRKDAEQRFTENIEALVGRTVGFDKVRANVSVDLNFDRITTNEEIFDPEAQVVRSTQTVEENSQERDAGETNVSVENNVPTTGETDTLEDGGTSAQANRVEETTNYEISRTVRNQVREVGEIKRLSIAVLVDGTYATDAEGKKTYTPRTQKELDQIAALVKSATGFDEARGDKVEVVNMQFAEVELPDAAEDMLFGFQKADLLDAAEIISVAVMMILVLLLVIQPMVGRILDTTPGGRGAGAGGGGLTPRDAEQAFDMLPGMQAHPALTGPQIAGQLEGPGSHGGGMIGSSGGAGEDSMIDMQRVEGQVKASTVKKVEEIVSAYPNETVSVLRNWMASKD